jgi:prepilin-type processing-associated H-X9-DG protein
MVCPSLDYQATIYKLKARNAACAYGYNLHLGQQSITLSRVGNPSGVTLFADAAQINDFQAPAAPDRPLLEEFYYLDADQGFGYPNAHFRHQRRAQAVFLDGHVDSESPVPGTIDARLPSQNIGRLRREALDWR